MIAVECFADEILVRPMGIRVARITHQKGKGNVVNAVVRGHASAGVIDQDPDSAQPSELSDFHLKRRRYERLPKYRAFLDQLGAKDAEFKTLRTWLAEA